MGAKLGQGAYGVAFAVTLKEEHSREEFNEASVKVLRPEQATSALALADMQSEEKTSVTEFASLKDAKSSEIAAGEEMVKEKTAAYATTISSNTKNLANKAVTSANKAVTSAQQSPPVT